MRSKLPPEELKARAITRLVDGAVTDAERSQVESGPDGDEVMREVAAQGQVARELRTGGPEVPDRLLASVRTRVEAAYGPGDRKRRFAGLAGGPSWRPVVVVAGLAAVCAAIALVVVGLGGGPASPTIPGAAKLAFAPSTGPAPGPAGAKLLDVSYAGVTFPNYAEFQVPPTGKRTDRLGGRPALTVFYRLPDGGRLSYTVFSGRPVALPPGTRTVVYEGVPLREFTTPSGLAVVTLVRFGRTCVLAARTNPDVLLGLAAAPVRAQAKV